MPRIIYFGQNEDGLLQLHIAKERYLLRGTARSKTDNGTMRLVAKTRGFTPTDADDRLWAVAKKSDPADRVLLRGRLIRVQPRSAPAATTDQRTDTDNMPPCQAAVDADLVKRKAPRMSSDDFAWTLKTVIEQHKAGLPAVVTVAFASAFLGESRATIWRRISRGELGNPIKRGKRTLIEFTELERLCTSSKSAT